MIVSEHADVGQWEQLVTAALSTGANIYAQKQGLKAAEKAEKQAAAAQAAEAARLAQEQAIRQQEAVLMAAAQQKRAAGAMWWWIGGGVVGLAVLGGLTYILLRK